jgi:hypothetical protein
MALILLFLFPLDIIDAGLYVPDLGQDCAAFLALVFIVYAVISLVSSVTKRDSANSTQ